MSPIIAIGILVAGLVLAFPLFAISGKISRNRATESDPKTRAEADRIFEAELADIPSEEGRDA